MAFRENLQSSHSKTRAEKQDGSFNEIYQSNIASGSQIAQLQDEGDRYTRKIDLERKNIKEIDKQISEVQEKIKKQRQEVQINRTQQETNDHLVRNIKKLENRLDKSLQKFNETVAHNKYLREKVNQLRREKLQNDIIQRNLSQEYEEWIFKNERINSETEQTEKEIRNAESQIIKLKAEAQKEREQSENQLKELNKLMEQDKNWREILKPQDQEQQLAIEDLHKEAMELKKKVKQSSGWGIARDKASIHDSIEKVQVYEEAFAKIQAATGISDIDELVKTFVEAEKHNFSLYNYVNELNNEMEALDAQISLLKQKIDLSSKTGSNSDNQRKRQIQEIDEKLSRADQKIQLNEEKYLQTMRVLNGLKVGVQSIFDRIGCNTETVQEMLGFSQVSEANLMQYLGIIEQRTNEILQLYSACQAQSIDTNALYQSPQVQNAGKEEKIKIEIPNSKYLCSE